LLCNLGTTIIYLLFNSFVRTFQVLFGEDRQNMLGDCFSVLVILILHRFDLVLHASLMIFFIFYFFFPYSMCLLFFFLKKIKKIKKNKKKIGGENGRNFIFSFLGMSDIACILP
jgi:hypothetical protein